MQFSEKNIVLAKSKQKMIVIIVLVGLVAVVVGLGIFSYLFSNRCFASYEVNSTIDRSDSNNVDYLYYEGNMLKYSRSGISEIDNEGKSLWNGGYEMKQPQVDTCGDYVIVADIGGKEVHIYNGKDEGTSIETSLPIVRAKVASQGVVAVLLEDKDSNVLNIYNPYSTAETLLVEIPTNVSEEGYPLDFDISPDGKSVVTSHMVVKGSSVENKVSFYNFSKVGQDKNTLVGGKSFGEETIAKIEFVDEDEVILFSEKGYVVFQEMRQPEIKLEKKFDEEIKSIAFDKDYVAVVTEKDGKQENQKLFLYNSKGNEKLQRNIPYEYADMKIYGEEIIFVGNRSCNILRFNGKDKFKHEFEQEIDALFPTSNREVYTLIDSSTIQQITLRKGD